MSALPPITRPNGKLYRPRHLRSQLLGDEDEVNEIVVFGTLLVAEARGIAELDARALSRQWYPDGDTEFVLVGDPKPVWYRREFRGIHEDSPVYGFVVDEEKGAFGYLWRIEDRDILDSRPDGVMPPPLDGLEALATREENTNGSAGGDHDHRPVQHRDGKPPWCKVCGLTTEGLEPVSRLSGRPPSEDTPK